MKIFFFVNIYLMLLSKLKKFDNRVKIIEEDQHFHLD